ncbi:HEAT repeat domain-containing protein [Massilia sp. W12]|uniref:HEAT repeat domain-containing protein n=1 Tax=Massilia sp. W12 TaxID=3126507 RepID=UPI0030D30A2F
MTEHNELRAALHSKDIAALWSALAKVSKCEGAPFLAEALLADWHESHEDIVFELGLIGDPRTTESIARAVVTTFQYMVEWDNIHEFQRKCAYALARIGSAESRVALENLAKHSDPYLRGAGEEGLEHWPLPYRKGEYA